MRHALLTLWRVLTFQATDDELRALDARCLVAGLLFTWLAGMGRWWDDPSAQLAQKLGVGSLVYVLVLASVLYLIAWPLRPVRWTWLNVLAFVTLTSPPALLYAIPVERFVGVEAAASANVWFLAIVATWRVLLLGRFLRAAGLSTASSVVACLLPITGIVTALTFMNLHHVVFSVMAGLRDEPVNPHAGAYFVLMLLTGLSMLAVLPLLVMYVFEIVAPARVPAVSPDALSLDVRESEGH